MDFNSNQKMQNTMKPETDTPETDGEWNRLACLENPEFEQRIADFARKLERERDEARRVIEQIEERYIDGCNTYEDWKFMGTIAREFFSENVQADLPATVDSALRNDVNAG